MSFFYSDAIYEPSPVFHMYYAKNQNTGKKLFTMASPDESKFGAGWSC
jgi:hypothetical protein